MIDLRELRPNIPVFKLYVEGLMLLLAVMNGYGAVVLLQKDAIWKGLIMLPVALGWAYLFLRGALQSFRIIRDRDKVAMARRESLDRMEREFQNAPDDQKGRVLADQIVAILDGKECLDCEK